MTTFARSFVFAPLSGLWSSLERTTQIVGYSRAAAELARQGLHEESKACILQVAKLKEDQ